MRLLLTALLVLFTLQISAQSCADNWVTIDDNTGKKKSVVKLYKKDKKLYGKIVYIFPRKGVGPNPKCAKCTGDRKNKPLLNMQIVRHLKWNGSEWYGGTIMDPENGKTYKVKMWLDKSDPDRLYVRGYSGPLFRTQTWIRMPKEKT